MDGILIYGTSEFLHHTRLKIQWTSHTLHWRKIWTNSLLWDRNQNSHDSQRWRRPTDSATLPSSSVKVVRALRSRLWKETFVLCL